MEVASSAPGMLTTVQDLGRRGHLSEGVPFGGAADPFALRVANLLVGNPEDSPGLEITLTGPELEFSEAAWVAVCGARFEGVPAWKPFRVEAGGRLKLGKAPPGVPRLPVGLGRVRRRARPRRAGNFLAAGGIGGFQGRRSGPAMSCGRRRRVARRPATGASMSGSSLATRGAGVRVVPGLHAGEFGDALYSGRFASQWSPTAWESA
jgi:antagonist of KipI